MRRQEYICTGGAGDPLRLFVVPVDEDTLKLCGDPVEWTAHVPQSEVELAVVCYQEDRNKDRYGPLSDITPPDQFKVVARYWHSEELPNIDGNSNTAAVIERLIRDGILRNGADD